MLITLHRKLTMVNADRDGWEDKVREHIDQGTNFLLILRKDSSAVKTFCKLFDLPDDCQPKVLTQGEFFLMSQHVEHDTFDAILHHWDDKHEIVFVEQIDFPMNRPPRLRLSWSILRFSASSLNRFIFVKRKRRRNITRTVGRPGLRFPRRVSITGNAVNGGCTKGAEV